MQVTLVDAKANLSEYVRLAERGETVTITVDGYPVAELRAVAKAARKLTPAEIVMVEAFSEQMCAKAKDGEAFDVLEVMENIRR